MTRARQDRLLTLLTREGDWLTAATMADALGVTPRSVRSYVTAVNARVPGTAIESGPQGYRAGPDATAALRAGNEAATPRDRLHTLVRTLLDEDDGIDVFETAERLYVSPATIDADLARVRGLLGGTELTLERSAARARLRGTEAAQRRLLSRLAHDEMEAGSFDLEALRRTLGTQSVGAQAFGPFKTELVAGLGELGYFVNELGIADVVMHIAIAADRVSRDRALDGGGTDDDPARAEISALIDRLSVAHLGVSLGAGDLAHLATLILTRIVAPGEGPADRARDRLDPEVERVVREMVESAASEFLVDIAHEDFVLRLALHVQNLMHRAREQAWSRNPLTRSLKSTYPMIFEVAVFIASGLADRLGIPLMDDEIAYIAMHVGGRLERSRRADQLLTATIVCPGYYELHELLRSSIDRSLGQAVEVVGVETRADPDWAGIQTDLVLTTIDPPTPNDRFVRIQPFLTDGDVERVQAAAGRVRRGRRLARLRAELERYFSPAAFIRGLDGGDEEAVIRRLGGLLVAEGVIDEDYVQRTIERERLSSTAFTDALAVPHAIGMTATRTAIAIGIAEPSIAWGEGRVQVVAFTAFSESDRAAFQTVFEQFVEVFSERESVQRIVRRGTDFAAFLDELVAVIDG
ncbi:MULTISPECIES: PTS sugar transporter subunit IIA [unclassified Microbacterium]|uniref:BglG family transcription antiterminator n=1 Tax=unclassified Microbacterium TaxID=2609290 RepID=UPI00214B81A0|nr:MULTISPECIES: PTS sugar transporter subunit IIA [unclassified Microbacterium]MCR2785181.1 PTS sugar transporter subunit IIA [Microbacterium sp. zg.B96]MDL5352543.1 PTS sugar transporter subunit IIA [Microbacterium sp. zg-YB36]WIM16714.1 PTS sugar transporter subunit IIA [Microbacterium sp. zg-B96]